ncbi:MAG: hypothetical protein ACPGSG_02730 [Prolixibacteraceae bacterium]
MSQKGINTEEEYRDLLMKHLVSLANGEADANGASESISSILDAYEAKEMEEDTVEEMMESNLMESCV